MSMGDILHGLFRRKRLEAAESAHPTATPSEPVEAVTGANTGAPEAPAFDPGAHTVNAVREYLAEHPDERDAVLAAEAAGKARKSILAL